MAVSYHVTLGDVQTDRLVHQFMGAIGRACSVVNLDPANDHTNYPAALDIRNLVKLEEIMKDDKLGPNGGILYALEELEHNFEWLEEGLKEFSEDYILFDCPGQVELYTHHNSLRNIFYKLQKIGFRVGNPCCWRRQQLTVYSSFASTSPTPSASHNRRYTYRTSSFLSVP
jgi:GTPase SAR1 family protein